VALEGSVFQVQFVLAEPVLAPHAALQRFCFAQPVPLSRRYLTTYCESY
jgi:hypothetical protein